MVLFFSVNSHMQNITQTENDSFHEVSPYIIMAVSNEASSVLLCSDVHAQDDGAHQFNTMKCTHLKQ